MRYLVNIEIENFGNHKKTVLSCNKGLYVFTGENGAGKSTIIDAIVWCLYARTVRAKSNWKPNNEKTNVVLTFSDGLIISRDTKLYIIESEYKYMGRNASNRIVELFGTYKEFMRSFILHKRYLSNFSMATDSEKKNILEGILGFDSFDIAHSRIKTALKDFQYIVDKLNMKVRSIEYDLKGLERSVSDANEFLVVDYSEELKALQSELELTKLYDIPTAPNSDKKDSIAKSIEEKKAHIRRLEKDINDCKSSITNNKCSLCGSENFDICKLQAIIESKEDLWYSIESELNTLEIEYEKSCVEYDNSFIDYRDKWAECKLIGERCLRKKDRICYLESHEKNRLRAKDNIEILEKTISDKNKELELLLYKHITLLDKIERYKIYRVLYGSKGLRLKLLYDALSIISKYVSNIYNSIWYGHIEHTTSFKPIIREREGGLLFGVNKNSTFISYSGLSEGEKGVFDIAVLKSLYYLSAKKTYFPIVYDDIFDAFDDKVTEKLIKYVCKESDKCSVFIITHNEKLINIINKYIDNVLHYRVTNGCIYGA